MLNFAPFKLKLETLLLFFSSNQFSLNRLLNSNLKQKIMFRFKPGFFAVLELVLSQELLHDKGFILNKYQK